MSGTGAGRGSGRAHFRSKSGCCICGTKSSSSRFTASERYAEHFGNCFGETAADRSGDLCNACVLCVKRWSSRGKEIGHFRQVLDSKQGPGPKHMKEIAKRARRREAKKQQQQQHQNINQQLQKHLTPHSHQSFSPSSSRVASGSNSRVSSLSKNSHSLASCSANNNASSLKPSTSPRLLNGGHHLNPSHYGHHLATCVTCWARQNKDTNVPSDIPRSSTNGNGIVAASTPISNAAGGVAFHPPVNIGRTRSSMSRKFDLTSKSGSSLAKREFDAHSGLANFSDATSVLSSQHYAQGNSDSSSFKSISFSLSCFGDSSGDNHSQTSLQHNHEHFRPPRPPPGISHQSSGGMMMVGNAPSGGNGNLSGVGVLTRAAASAASNCVPGFFDGGASSTCSSTTSTPSTPTRKHNRRTKLPPVKISSSGIEVDDILRKIQKESKNMDLDNHQINMAVQREIRLRNRIINPPQMTPSGDPNRTPSTSSVNDPLDNFKAASTTTLSNSASVEDGSSVDAAVNFRA